MIKKQLAAALVSLGILACTGVAFAAPYPQPPVLQVDPSGHALMRGTVESVSSSSFTVRTWGGLWTVSLASKAQLLPQGIALSDIKSGDYVGLEGALSTSSSLTVSASLVHDWDSTSHALDQARANYQAAYNTLQSAPHTVQGTVSNRSGNTFTLNLPGGKTLSASLASGVQVLRGNWLSFDFDSVQNGDLVRAFGPLSGTSLSVSILRDLSR